MLAHTHPTGSAVRTGRRILLECDGDADGYGTWRHERGETPARTRDVVDTYRTVAHSEGVSPVSERSVRDYLGELAQLGITGSTEHNRGKVGGKYNEHRLEQSVSAVRSGLSTLLESA
ncbi:hypothetical protein [Halorubrum sp. 48-1-W]|uniref:hypothetical protein n=1 Tax=Halorubrum sp. 48-1-W TaxID=2249761 RepID=UPI001F53F8A4|nr:hypothetical protein [Halorubrum sp. 48-1-W]